MIIPVETYKQKFVSLLTNRNLRAIARGILTGIIALIISISFAVLIVSYYFFSQVRAFSNTSEMSFSEIKQVAQTFYKQTKNPLTEPQTLLILGVDKLDTRPGSPVLTDTILITKLDFSDASLTILPIPRDLWSENHERRVNTLYNLALEDSHSSPASFVAGELTDLTGVKIDHGIVIEMTELARLIDLVGGIEIDVKEAFVDEQFPRGDVDVTQVTDPELLYKTVEFKQGPQTLDGERSLEYIRSRKSVGAEGTDLARSQRQQQVIMALFAKLKDTKSLANPIYLGNLAKYYKMNFEKYLQITTLTHYLATLGKDSMNLQFNNATVTIYPDDENGVLYHPSPKLYNDQWLYVIRDEEDFKEYVQTTLGFVGEDENASANEENDQTN